MVWCAIAYSLRAPIADNLLDAVLLNAEQNFTQALEMSRERELHAVV